MPYALTYARGEYSVREALLLKVLTDDPAVFGWGESAMWGGPHAVTATVVEREIFPLIEGEDPRRPEYLWEKVFQETYYHRGYGLDAFAGDVAKARALGFRGYKMKIGNIRQAAHYGVIEGVPMRGS